MRTNPVYTASRIDFALISQGLFCSCVNTMYLAGIKSNHLAYYLAVDQILQERGPGFWKFNNLLLTDLQFCKQMNSCIEDTLNSSNNLDPTQQWLFLKDEMSSMSKDYSRKLASEKSLIISQLSEHILALQHEVDHADNPTVQQFKILENSKQEIEELLEEKMKGVFFRTKSRWYELGEHNSKFFFNLEKSRYNARVCTRLFSHDGKEVTNQKDISNLQTAFYQELYKSDKTVQFDLNNTYGIKVPEEMRQQHEQEFSMDELINAIKQLRQNQTPGIGGLTADFYKMFFGKIKDVLYQAIMDFFHKGQLPKKLRHAIINLIPKSGKDT